MKLLSLVIVFFFIISCRGKAVKKQEAQDIVHNAKNVLDTIVKGNRIIVKTNIDREESELIICNTHSRDSVILDIDGLPAELLLEQLEYIQTSVGILRFSEQLSCVVIVLLNERGFYIPEKCNYYINYVDKLSINNETMYVTYEPLDCHGDIWKSERIEFTQDSFKILDRYSEDFCSTDRVIQITSFREDKPTEKSISTEFDSLSTKDLNKLWSSLVQEGYVF